MTKHGNTVPTRPEVAMLSLTPELQNDAHEWSYESPVGALRRPSSDRSPRPRPAPTPVVRTSVAQPALAESLSGLSPAHVFSIATVSGLTGAGMMALLVAIVA